MKLCKTHVRKTARREDYVWQSCVCVTKMCVTKLCVKDCVRQSCVWQSCVCVSVKDCVCVWQSCVCKIMCDNVVCDKDVCDKVACERLCVCVAKLCVCGKNVCNKAVWERLCVCVTKLCVTKLCACVCDKLHVKDYVWQSVCVCARCVCVWQSCVCVWQVVCVRVSGTERTKKEEEEADGIQNQKQEPHTKMWGKKWQKKKLPYLIVSHQTLRLWKSHAIPLSWSSNLVLGSDAHLLPWPAHMVKDQFPFANGSPSQLQANLPLKNTRPLYCKMKSSWASAAFNHQGPGCHKLIQLGCQRTCKICKQRRAMGHRRRLPIPLANGFGFCGSKFVCAVWDDPMLHCFFSLTATTLPETGLACHSQNLSLLGATGQC